MSSWVLSMKIYSRYKKLKIFRQTLFIVSIILIVKVILNYNSLEFIPTSSLLTSIIAGSFFVLGFMLSSNHADYKESEKLPINLSNSIESIYNDGLLFKMQYKKFNDKELNDILYNIIILFKKDLVEQTNKSFFKTKELSNVYFKLEKLGVPANYIVKLKQDQNNISQAILRINYIQRIQPIPSAFILIESLVYGLILILLITKMESLFKELIAIGFITFIFIYMLKLIKVLEKPFQIEGSTMDDISLFHLEEQAKRIKNNS